MAKMSKFIRDILKANDVDPREACWDCHGTWVILHKALERIADKNGVEFEPLEIIEAHAEKKIAVIRARGRIGDGTPVCSIGEAAPYNNKNGFPFAMAEKRAKDRVILKLVGLSGHLYSEEEADSFKESAPRPPAPATKAAPPAPQQPQPVAVAPAPTAPAAPAAPVAPAAAQPAPPKGGPDHYRGLVMGMFVNGDEELKRQVLMEKTGMNRGQAARALKSLVEDGTLVQKGERRGAYYITSERNKQLGTEEPAPIKQEGGLEGEELKAANEAFRESIRSPEPPTPAPPAPAPSAPDANGDGHRGWNQAEFESLLQELTTQTGASMLTITQWITQATGFENGFQALQAGAITSETAEHIRRLASSHVNQIAS